MCQTLHIGTLYTTLHLVFVNQVSQIQVRHCQSHVAEKDTEAWKIKHMSIFT